MIQCLSLHAIVQTSKYEATVNEHYTNTKIFCQLGKLARAAKLLRFRCAKQPMQHAAQPLLSALCTAVDGMRLSISVTLTTTIVTSQTSYTIVISAIALGL